VLELVIGIAVVLAVLLVVSVTFLAPRRRRPLPPVPPRDVVPGVGDDAETPRDTAKRQVSTLDLP
jgi:fused signal recognition particle receptor